MFRIYLGISIAIGLDDLAYEWKIEWKWKMLMLGPQNRGPGFFFSRQRGQKPHTRPTRRICQHFKFSDNNETKVIGDFLRPAIPLSIDRCFSAFKLKVCFLSYLGWGEWARGNMNTPPILVRIKQALATHRFSYNKCQPLRHVSKQMANVKRLIVIVFNDSANNLYLYLT